MNPLLEETLAWVRSQIRAPDPDAVVSEEMRRDAALVQRMTSGDDGAAFLLLLAKLSVFKPALNPALHGSASHDFAQRRTGENGVFAALIHYRDLADILNERTADHDRRNQRFDFGWGDRPGDGGPVTDERFGSDDGWDPGGHVGGA